VSGRMIPLLLIPVVLVAAACSGDDDTGTSGDRKSTDAETIEVTLTDAGCEPQEIETKAGPHTFEVTNDGSAAVTEWEVLKGDRILGEVENIIPGDTRSFSLTLKEGDYTSYCPGGSDNEGGTLKVTKVAGGESAASVNTDQAVADYLTYVKDEADQLIADVEPFAAAVKAGDVAQAQQLFAGAREHYEFLLRRGYSFTDGIDPRTGQLDAGLFFLAYQRDPRRQFVPLQQRLAEADALNEYIQHVGSAVFAIPPGISGPGDHIGAGLLAQNR